ncbi:MAG: 4-alpha-glucanotransferase, partial [Gemmatimonadota bacterium]
MTSPRGLHTLARLHGVQTSYRGHAGDRVTADAEVLMAVLRAMGVPVRDAAGIPAALDRRRRELCERGLEPVVVVWLDDPAPVPLRLPAAATDAAIRVRVDLEEGGGLTRDLAAGSLEPVGREEADGRAYVEVRVPLPRVPAGYYELGVEVGHRRYRAVLIAAPRRTAGWEVLPGRGHWGVFAPLYALREARAPDRVPHFGLLDRLAEQVAALGGDVVGTLPLLAMFLDRPYEPSPYAPVSRLFWNELYLSEPDAELGHGDPRGGLDPRAAMGARRRRLEAQARAFFADRDRDADGPGANGTGSGLRVPPVLEAFVARSPGAPDYARFRALTELHGPWPGWPDRLRARDVRADDYRLETARYHLYAQWQAERQLTDTAARARDRGVALYLD